jgi:hypothetical protein
MFRLKLDSDGALYLRVVAIMLEYSGSHRLRGVTAKSFLRRRCP